MATSHPVVRERVPPTRQGVWGVRNFHTTLLDRARAGAELTGGYLSMVIASAVMATAGLLLDSPAVVIGSMCVAPFMSSSRAVCVGVLYRDWGMFWRGLIKQLVGLLLIGTGVAIVMTTVLNQSVEGIGLTNEILIRAMPTTRDVVLSVIVAVSAGAAASLALVAQPRVIENPWGQVIDAIIGVQIAISLIPPAAVIGIGLALGQPEYSLHAFYLLLLNVVGLDFVGSLSILAVGGVRREHLGLEESVRACVADVLDVVPGFISLGSTVDVTLFPGRRARIDVICRRQYGGKVPDSLAREITTRLEKEVNCRSEVSVEVIPVLVDSNVEASMSAS